MTQNEFDKLPYYSRTELIDLRTYCLTTLEANSDVIYQDNVPDVLYQFRDKTKKFAFNIRDVNFTEEKKCNTYKLYFSHKNLFNNEDIVRPNIALEQLKVLFEKWIDNLRKLHFITEEYFNPDKKFYDEQFKDFFINEDEDAAIAPFDIERQELLFYFLNFAETKIQHSDEMQGISLFSRSPGRRNAISHTAQSVHLVVRYFISHVSFTEAEEGFIEAGAIIMVNSQIQKTIDHANTQCRYIRP